MSKVEFEKRKIYGRHGKEVFIDLPKSKLTKNQIRKFKKTVKDENYGEIIIEVTARFDDSCGNGHNSFGLTADIKSKYGKYIAGGCCHDEIIEHFPELKKFVKWHLCSTDGPLHYLANTLYHASDKDYNGKSKGEPISFDFFIKFESFPVTFQFKKEFMDWISSLSMNEINQMKVVAVEYNGKSGYKLDSKFTFTGFHDDDWYKAPFDSKTQADQFLEVFQNYGFKVVKQPARISEGKEIDLEAARHSAIWPDAQLSDLTEENLLKRLQGLLLDFRAAMVELCFEY